MVDTFVTLISKSPNFCITRDHGFPFILAITSHCTLSSRIVVPWDLKNNPLHDVSLWRFFFNISKSIMPNPSVSAFRCLPFPPVQMGESVNDLLSLNNSTTLEIWATLNSWYLTSVIRSFCLFLVSFASWGISGSFHSPQTPTPKPCPISLPVANHAETERSPQCPNSQNQHCASVCIQVHLLLFL